MPPPPLLPLQSGCAPTPPTSNCACQPRRRGCWTRRRRASRTVSGGWVALRCAALRCAVLRCAVLCCAVLCCAGLGWAGAGAGRCGRAALVVVVVVMGVVCVQPAWRCPGPSGRGFCCMLSGSGLQWLHGGCQPVQQQEGRKRREGGAKERSRNREHRAQATVAEAIGGWRVQPRRLAQHSSSCSSRLGMPPLTGNRRPAAAAGQATAAAAGSRRGQSGGGGGVAGRSLAGMACRAMLPAPEAPCGRLASRHAAPGPLPALPCRLARDPAAALRSRPPLARLAPPRSAPFAQDARLVCGPCGGTGSRYCMHLPTHQPRRPRQGQAGGGSGHNHPHPPSVCRSSARFCSARRASPKQPPVCVCVCAPTSLWAHQRPFLQVHLQQRVVELFKKVFVLPASPRWLPRAGPPRLQAAWHGGVQRAQHRDGRPAPGKAETSLPAFLQARWLAAARLSGLSITSASML